VGEKFCGLKKTKAGLPIGKKHRHGNPASMGCAVTLILRQPGYPAPGTHGFPSSDYSEFGFGAKFPYFSY